MNLITSRDDGVRPLDGDLTDKVLVINHLRLGRPYQLPRFQLFKATGGFGCKPNTLGQAVFGYHLADMESARWNRSDFIGVPSDELITAAMADARPVAAIDLSARVYMVIAKDGSRAVGETPTEAMTRLRRITASALLNAYHAHPESSITDLGHITYPSGASPVEVKLKKRGKVWIDAS